MVGGAGKWRRVRKDEKTGAVVARGWEGRRLVMGWCWAGLEAEREEGEDEGDGGWACGWVGRGMMMMMMIRMTDMRIPQRRQGWE